MRDDENSEDSAIALDVDRRTGRGGPLLLRNLASALPRRALEDLSQSELIRSHAGLLANLVCNSVAS